MKTKFVNSLLKSGILLGILSVSLNAKYLTNLEFRKELNKKYFKQITILGKYIIKGFHSKNDVNGFIKTYNQIFSSIKSPVQLDKYSFLEKSYGKNGTIFATIIIKYKNKQEIRKVCKSVYDILKTKKPDNIDLKKCQERIDNIVLDTNLYKKCKMLYGKNFYKYGGRLKYTLKDENYGLVFTKTVKSDNDCDKIRQDILNNFKAIKNGE